MGRKHYFEFMDGERIPQSLRHTLRDILECGNSKPFRKYYHWITNNIIRECSEKGFSKVVELGAGTAPVTRHLAATLYNKKDGGESGGELTLIPTDLNPDKKIYSHLAGQYRNLVQPVMEPVDFSKPGNYDKNTLIVLSATFHHIAPEIRKDVLKVLSESAGEVLIFEPLRNNGVSILFVLFSILSSLLTPLFFINRPGRVRRFLWSWLMIAPLTFMWDGIISALRCWKEDEWVEHLREVIPPEREITIRTLFFCSMIKW